MMKQIRAISRTLLISASLCVALLSTSLFAASQGELKGVSSEISRQQKNLSSQQKKLDNLQAPKTRKAIVFLSCRVQTLDLLFSWVPRYLEHRMATNHGDLSNCRCRIQRAVAVLDTAVKHDKHDNVGRTKIIKR